MSDELARHEPRADLLAPLVAPFRLTAGERALGRLLVWLVRVPGAARLLMLWHARRSRP